MSEIKKVFMKGNEAIAHSAIAAGCKAYFGYPITPQNEIPETLSELLPKTGGQFIQAESETAAASMLLGAVATGVRAFTSSSSPGISLMQEAISYMAGSELPAVIVNISRGGPGLGDIGSSQGDYFQSVKGGGHGDYKLLVLAPSSCQEAYDLMIDAFDLAFKYKNPVMLLGDAIIGGTKEPVVMHQPNTINQYNSTTWRLDGRGESYREKRLIKSLLLDEGSLAEHNLKLAKKYNSMQADVRFESIETEDAEVIAVAFGSIGRIVKSSIKKLRAEGLKVGLIRPITLFPFPSAVLNKLAKQNKKFLVIEHNLGQMVEDVKLAVNGLSSVNFFGCMPGNLPSTEDFIEPLKKEFNI
ncbi:3-methyl-2-oxobutanoate dehydrogenase subunit VorB [Desulfovibrio litoralis]|uniref:2-oxoglutarate ferredoxin oxidoreductase subunit alpha n=1 Tax=Desulfovibrio litoralis DSM 11393 TaxID=1121455 RepID=A0A1M7SF10_9BACT|nr:3-methyl-2-oxobutanoate dehydrogenase subunit VorB [Desulfovibrio litoralis]SHN57065.1 2-oxoglutarate ferredoxin oxidoreductase subunit alpha [Desulfovibrio litoralis DSM 11393]